LKTRKNSARLTPITARIVPSDSTVTPVLQTLQAPDEGPIHSHKMGQAFLRGDPGPLPKLPKAGAHLPAKRLAMSQGHAVPTVGRLCIYDAVLRLAAAARALEALAPRGGDEPKVLGSPRFAA
jgi:hypothetical protein